ncbi:MAG: transaldolase [Gammaproteobacteria bacterium]|nr:transaldolase [Gammaproteobacteria bacterium]
MNPLKALQDQGQSIWLDYIQRSMLASGELNRLIVDDGLRGVTSNPAIFEKAIASSQDYDQAIETLVAKNPGFTSQDLFYALAIEDIQGAADVFRPVYETSRSRDGYVSLEVSPDLAYDTAGTVNEARSLWARVNRANLMIKVPATQPGIAAIETLIAEGINVNATLLFSVERYQQVAEAFLRGLEQRRAHGKPVANIASVASFFVSRVDSNIDKQLSGFIDKGKGDIAFAREMLGKVAIANAKLAFAAYRELFGSARFAKLAKAGAQSQRVLWASTGTKNDKYSDVLYVETLIGTDTVNTLPPATLKAFRDHGKVAATLEHGTGAASRQVDKLKNVGIDLHAVSEQLEQEGVKIFIDAFHNLLGVIDGKVETFRRKRKA